MLWTRGFTHAQNNRVVLSTMPVDRRVISPMQPPRLALARVSKTVTGAAFRVVGVKMSALDGRRIVLLGMSIIVVGWHAKT